MTVTAGRDGKATDKTFLVADDFRTTAPPAPKTAGALQDMADAFSGRDLEECDGVVGA